MKTLNKAWNIFNFTLASIIFAMQNKNFGSPKNAPFLHAILLLLCFTHFQFKFLSHKTYCKYFYTFKILPSVWLGWIWYQNVHKCVENTQVGVTSADNLAQNNPVAGSGLSRLFFPLEFTAFWGQNRLQKLCKMGYWLVKRGIGPLLLI